MALRRTSIRTTRVVGLLLVAALLAAACAELPRDELAGRYGIDESDIASASSDSDTTDSANSDSAASGSAASDSATSDSAAVGDATTTFGDCPFDDSAWDVDCGTVEITSGADNLIIPIEIAFARFNATGDNPTSDPVVYLHGGPGGAVLAEADGFARSIVVPFLEDRDVILYDQRGAGESSPLPICRETWTLDEAFYNEATPHAELSDDYTELVVACAERITRRTSIDFSAYASATHADDFIALIGALGYDEANLYGNSYGSRLAQTILRDHPDPVRSVMLSGIYPTEVNLIGSVPATFAAAFTALMEGCAAVASCAAELPDPLAALERQVAALDAAPPSFEIPFDDVDSYTMTLAGDDLLNILHGLLYTSAGAALIPDLLIDLEAGDRDRLERLAADAIYDTADVGGYLGVQCREEVPFITDAELARASQLDTIWDRVNLPPGLLGGDLIEMCAAWEAFGVADPIENEPVTWDHPTLILSGGFDPITPPEWARSLSERLPNATLAFSIDRGHDADEGFCVVGLMTEFIESPDSAIDTGCTTEVSEPTITTTNVTVQERNRIELNESIFDVDPGPDTEWVDMRLPDWTFDFYDDEEAYWRDLDIYDQTLIVVRSGAFSRDELTFYLPNDTGAIDFEPTANPGSVGAEWERLFYDSNSYDIVSYVSTGEPQMNVSVIARPADLADLETSLIEMVNSVVAG